MTTPSGGWHPAATGRSEDSQAPIRLTGPPTPPGIERSTTGHDDSGGQTDALSDARRLGEAQAELVHLRLRLKESIARELRLVERTLRAEEALEQALTTEHDLRDQVSRYADFHDAVLRSRAWRIIQALRKLVGRAW